MENRSMWSYTPPLRDMQFVMEELLDVRKDWHDMPRFTDLDENTVPQILEEAGKFASQTLAPLNSVGDLSGCRLEGGIVTLPDGFVAAYRQYCESGWPSLACDTDWGGQALPQILNAALYEMLNATNHGWTMYPGLAHGAYECLRAHASDSIKAVYLPKIVSGEWLSTMCLTEPQAGSDVGLLRTRAELQADGSYAIGGSKIFISGGEHDMTGNIVHLVLARLPDAPAGTRGVSLFLVPKHLPGADLKRTNGVRCDGIEKKMGIRGSATCVITFDRAKGWIIGEPHGGLAALFVMMNSARLSVGLQGLGHAEMAYQNALRYANERLQMRAVARPDRAPSRPAGEADPIAYHAPVRQTLATLRAYVEGERALGYWCAHLLDIAQSHPNLERRTEAHDLASLLTPIIKSFFTESGFSLSSAALQVWGGYGYVQDYGIEQTVRDSRIAMIYEGTNEIQAVDLLVRKVIADSGNKLSVLLRLVGQEATLCLALPGCERFGETLGSLQRAATRVTANIITDAAADPEVGHRVANDFLKLMGLLLLGSFWARTARLSMARTSEPFYDAKLDTARFYFDYVLPEADLRLALLEQRHCPLPWAAVPS